MSNDTQFVSLPGYEAEAIRREERARCAALIREHADTFADFAASKRAAVLLVAMTLDGATP